MLRLKVSDLNISCNWTKNTASGWSKRLRALLAAELLNGLNRQGSTRSAQTLDFRTRRWQARLHTRTPSFCDYRRTLQHYSNLRHPSGRKVLSAVLMLSMTKSRWSLQQQRQQ
jgi:hypothetical protein